MEIIKCFMEGDKYSPLYKITPSSEEEERFLDALLKAYRVFDKDYHSKNTVVNSTEPNNNSSSDDTDEFFDDDDENFEPFNG